MAGLLSLAVMSQRGPSLHLLCPAVQWVALLPCQHQPGLAAWHPALVSLVLDPCQPVSTCFCFSGLLWKSLAAPYSCSGEYVVTTCAGCKCLNCCRKPDLLVVPCSLDCIYAVLWLPICQAVSRMHLQKRSKFSCSTCNRSCRRQQRCRCHKTAGWPSLAPKAPVGLIVTRPWSRMPRLQLACSSAAFVHQCCLMRGVSCDTNVWVHFSGSQREREPRGASNRVQASFIASRHGRLRFSAPWEHSAERERSSPG